MLVYQKLQEMMSGEITYVLLCCDVPACNDDNVLVILMFLHVMMVMFCQCSDVPACSDDNVLAQCNRHFRCNICISIVSFCALALFICQ